APASPASQGGRTTVASGGYDAGTPGGTDPSGGRPVGGGRGTLLPVPPSARSVVYLLDRSSSMGESHALARARRELLASLRQLPPTARFQVIPYNKQAEPLWVGGRGGLLPADADTVREVRSEERRVGKGGGWGGGAW